MPNCKKFFLIFLTIFFLPLFSQAASLSFSAPEQSYSVGDTFSLNINVSSSDQSINAASGVISFPWDKLEVVSVSKTQSIFSLWVQEPSFSNANGTVNFEGIVLNPGFSGANGRVITITFKTKNTGSANLSFSSGSVLANDGTGMNVLDSVNVAVINILSVKTIPAVLSVPDIEAPNTSSKYTPVILSVTHPDQTLWYKNNIPELYWVLPADALEVRTLLSISSSAVPSVKYNPPIDKKILKSLADGIYYFHLQIKTTSGWSDVAHYKINIDTTPPKPFSITFPHGIESFEPQPVIMFNTTDEKSGISSYDIKIGEGGAERRAPSANSNPYPLPPQNPGRHIVTVTAIDRAGNISSSTADFIIKSIEAPKINYSNSEIEYGDLVNIRGSTYPDSDVYTIVRRGDELITKDVSRSTLAGDFSSIITKKLVAGLYIITAYTVDERGAKSVESDAVSVLVKTKPWFGTDGLIFENLSIMAPAMIMFGSLLVIIVLIWARLGRIDHLLALQNKLNKVLSLYPRKKKGDEDIKHYKD